MIGTSMNIDFRSFARLTATLLLVGCASQNVGPPPGSFRSDGFSKPPTGSTVLLLHVPAPTLAFRSGDPLVVSAVQRQLANAGYRLGLVKFEDYALLVKDELGSLGPLSTGSQTTDAARAEARALSRLARIAGSTSGAALLVSTRLVLRETEIWQSHASWDGQKRAIQFKGTNLTLASIQGSGPGLSIELLAHSVDGRLQAKWYGGASLPYIADGTSGRQPLPRDDLFSNGDELAQGVQLSLVPLLRD